MIWSVNDMIDVTQIQIDKLKLTNSSVVAEMSKRSSTTYNIPTNNVKKVSTSKVNCNKDQSLLNLKLCHWTWNFFLYFKFPEHEPPISTAPKIQKRGHIGSPMHFPNLVWCQAMISRSQQTSWAHLRSLETWDNLSQVDTYIPIQSRSISKHVNSLRQIPTHVKHTRVVDLQ